MSRNLLFTFSFIIPQGNDDGVCYASIMKTYLDALVHDQVDLRPESPLIRIGRKSTPTTNSCFLNMPMGKNYLCDIGRYIANYLKLPDHLEYSISCFLISG